MSSIAFLNVLRAAEIHAVAPLIPVGSQVLEIGAGTGQQALALSQMGYRVEALDLEGGHYSGHQVFPVAYYDGETIPSPSNTFDAVYTSSVLEHLDNPARLHSEIRRVLKRGGIAVHVVPTHAWRAWTTATSVPSAVVQIAGLIAHPNEWRRRLRTIAGTLLPVAHGVHGSALSELWTYHPSSWRRELRRSGFVVLVDEPVGLFYTGNQLAGALLPFGTRKRLSSLLGSACHVFVVTAK